MEKCVLLFLFLIIAACSNMGEDSENNLVKFTHTGEISKFEQNGKFITPDTLSSDLRIMKFNKVSVWMIDSDIPDSLMKIQQNSIAVLGENAALQKVFALQFSQIILKPNFPEEKILKIIQNYDKILLFAGDNLEIIFSTDGVSWYR